jgi:hypothetical protein
MGRFQERTKKQFLSFEPQLGLLQKFSHSGTDVD